MMHITSVTLLLLFLTGCAHQAALQSSQGKQEAIAMIESNGNHSGKLTLQRHGQVYAGTWVATRVDESRQIASAYGVSSVRYQSYQRGLGSYLHQANAVLQSQRGDTFNCEFLYRGITAKGSCKSDTDYFEFLAKS